VDNVHLIFALLFAFSANIDNFTVGIAYGIKKIRIGLLSNLLIALVTATGTFVSMAAGLAVSRILTPTIANAVGSIILIMIGFWIIKDFFMKKKRPEMQKQKETHLTSCGQILSEPEKADSDHSGSIDLKESLILACALTINNFGLGIGASITGLNIYATVICTFLFSIISIALGCLVWCSYSFYGSADDEIY
jgi:putative sporulation protein YtaF